MKIYIVTAGEYSDYHICEVFENKEKAEKYVALQIELDKFYADSMYICERETHDHKIMDNFKVAPYHYCYINERGEIETEEDYVEKRMDKGDTIIEHDDYDGIEVYSKKSFEHAKKVCIEQYQIKTQQKLENGEL